MFSVTNRKNLLIPMKSESSRFCFEKDASKRRIPLDRIKPNLAGGVKASEGGAACGRSTFHRGGVVHVRKLFSRKKGPNNRKEFLQPEGMLGRVITMLFLAWKQFDVDYMASFST